MVTRRRAARALALLAAAALPVVGPGCGLGLVSFDVTQMIPAQTVPGNPLGPVLPAVLFSFPITVNLDSETQGHGTGPAKSAQLKSLLLEIREPAGATFDFLDSISITVGATGLPDVEVARLDDVPAQGFISIPPTPGVDLLPYIKAGATKLTATASGHVPAQNITFFGQVIVTIKV